MHTVICIVIAAICFLLFERQRLRRLLTSWRTRARGGGTGARTTVSGSPSLSARSQALIEFLEIMLGDVKAADRATWITAALAKQPAEGDATRALIDSHLGLPLLTLRTRVLLAVNSNSARFLQPMARDVAAAHGLTDTFDWDYDAPTNNTVMDGILAFDQWLASRGYTLLYLESGLDVPTTFTVRASDAPRSLACGQRAELTVLDGHAYRTSAEGSKTLAAAAGMRRDPAQNARLASSLAAAGFFAGLPEKRAKALDSVVKRLGYAGVLQHDWRAFDADDEELADGGVGKFLTRCIPAFEHLRVPALRGADRFAKGGDHILDLASGDGGSVILLSEADGFHLAQDLVAARLIRWMNGHLKAHGIEDRFYSVYSGNDAMVVLLNPAMLAVIESLPQLHGESMPHWRKSDR